MKRVRAIIKKNNSILLIHRIKKDREYWVFPGGGVEKSDANQKNALIRECKEELGVDVSVGSLFAVKKFNGVDEYFYFCEIIKGELGTGFGPEFQEGTNYEGEYILEWISFKEFSLKNIQPESIKEKLNNFY
ncbi:MAG: NUDIX domain-containing protein [Candidatus Falkowbacteria bacterium]